MQGIASGVSRHDVPTNVGVHDIDYLRLDREKRQGSHEGEAAAAMRPLRRAGIGAGIGVGIDAANKGHETLYEAR